MRYPLTYMRNFVDLAVARGASANTILAGTGLTLESGPTEQAIVLMPEQLSLFLDNCCEQLGPGWHVDAMLSLEMTHHGPVGAAAATAATLADALRVVARFIELRAPYVWLTMEYDESRCTLTLIQLVALHRHRCLLLEMAVLSVAKLIEKITGNTNHELTIRFDFPRPPYAAMLEQAGLGEIVFEQAKTELSLPAAWLDRANLMADPTLHDAAHHACQVQLEQFDGRSLLEIQIREKILLANGAAPKLASLAADFNMSGRTLIRKLKQHGTSYQAIVDDIHLKLAQYQLTYSHTPVAQIGYSLGFADPANFGRAFRNWTGDSPGAFRKRAQACK